MNDLKLEDLIDDVEWYRGVMTYHNTIPTYNMLHCYRMCRNEIVQKYDLQKGEFTKVFKYCKDLGKYELK